MDLQVSLFDEQPRYCLDTNVIVSFLRGTDDEFYGSDIFAPQWTFIEGLIDRGAVISPREVEHELLNWKKTIEQMPKWVKQHRRLFVDADDSAQLKAAKLIVNQFPAYASNINYVGDLSVMSLAKYLGLSVVTLEKRADPHSAKRPKIPNVCEHFDIECLSVAGLLRRENFGKGLAED